METILQSFLHWKSLLAVAVGMLVAYLGGRGAHLMTQSQPSSPDYSSGPCSASRCSAAFRSGR